MTRKMIGPDNLPISRKLDAVVHSFFIINRKESSITKMTTNERLFCRDPDVSMIRLFGFLTFMKERNMDKTEAFQSRAGKSGFVDVFDERKLYNDFDLQELQAEMISQDDSDLVATNKYISEIEPLFYLIS